MATRGALSLKTIDVYLCIHHIFTDKSTQKRSSSPEKRYLMWIKVHDNLIKHPKIKKLSRLLELSEKTIIGYMIALWLWCQKYAPDGDLSDYDIDDIECAVEWDGDYGSYFNGLVSCRLIDKKDDVYHIHNWWEYAGNLLIAKKKREQRKRRKQKLQKIEKQKSSKKQKNPKKSIDNSTDTTTYPKVSRTVRGQSVDCPGNVSLEKEKEIEKEKRSLSQCNSELVKKKKNFSKKIERENFSNFHPDKPATWPDSLDASQFAQAGKAYANLKYPGKLLVKSMTPMAKDEALRLFDHARAKGAEYFSYIKNAHSQGLHQGNTQAPGQPKKSLEKQDPRVQAIMQAVKNKEETREGGKGKTPDGDAARDAARSQFGV